MWGKHLDWENHSTWVLSWQREFSSQPLTEFWRHILSGFSVFDWGIFCVPSYMQDKGENLVPIYCIAGTTCAVHIEDCEGWWLSGCCSSVVERWWFQHGTPSPSIHYVPYKIHLSIKPDHLSPSRKVREGLAIVIRMHGFLTNQILNCEL